MKNVSDRLIRRLRKLTTKERINGLEHRSIEITQTNIQNEKTNNGGEKEDSRPGGQQFFFNIGLARVLERKEKREREEVLEKKIIKIFQK